MLSKTLVTNRHPSDRLGLAELVQAELIASLAYAAHESTECDECRDLFLTVATECSDRADTSAYEVADAMCEEMLKSSPTDHMHFWRAEQGWLVWRIQFLVRQQLSMTAPVSGLQNPVPSAEVSMHLKHPDVERALSMLDPKHIVDQTVAVICDLFGELAGGTANPTA